MRTITFHSYKGGTGRTMATSQLAVLLTRLGKSVVAMDLDVESPGLAYRLKSAFTFNLAPLGLLHQAREFRATGELLDVSQLQITLTPKLRLLTPGNPFDDSDYWETLDELESFEYAEAVAYFANLKAAIESRMKPEYLLIDAPSGFSTLASFCTNLMADMVVSLTTAEEDSLLGTNLVALRREGRKYTGQRVPGEVHYALCRYPDYYEGDKGMVRVEPAQLATVIDKTRGTLMSGLNQPGEIGIVRLIRSEPQLQMGDLLPIPLMGEPIQSSVVHDYCDLFSDMLPEYADRFGMLRSGVRVARSYYLLQDAGMMINPADQSWNVAFRVDTLLSFIDALVAGEGGASETAERTLFSGGYTAAKQFSEYLRSQWSGETVRETPQSKLLKWCDFDSSVGFGRFRALLSGDSAGEYATGDATGEILVNNNFLISGRTVEDQNLCGFMAGYITRILEVVYARKRVEVKHDLKTDCGQFTKHDPPVCRFRFVAKKGEGVTSS